MKHTICHTGIPFGLNILTVVITEKKKKKEKKKKFKTAAKYPRWLPNNQFFANNLLNHQFF